MLTAYGIGLEKSAPLLYDPLKESGLVPNSAIGKKRWPHLGPVSGGIVGEVVIGLLENDRASYLVQKPSFA